MGHRGPTPGAKYGRKPGPKPNPERSALLGAPNRQLAPSRAVELLPSSGPAPDPPAHLGEIGRRAWLGVWDGFGVSVLNGSLDYSTVQRFAEAMEERETYRTELARLGPTMVEPIVSPRGDVVGERIVLNPVEAALRRVNKELDAASDRLGLSPTARARLGLVVSQAQLAAGEAAGLLSHMRKDSS